MSHTDSVIDRLWTRLEARFESEDVGCGCPSARRGQAILAETALTMADFRAYQRGDRSMAEFVSTVDADLDPAGIDDLGTLVDELSRALETGEPDSKTAGY